MGVFKLVSLPLGRLIPLAASILLSDWCSLLNREILDCCPVSRLVTLEHLFLIQLGWN